MNSFEDLEFFAQLIQLGSLSALARERNVTPGAVSIRLNKLEKSLGVRLVNRSTRKLSLTEDGEILFARCSSLLSEFDDLRHFVAKGKERPRGLLRINAPAAFGRKQLAPIIADYLAMYPEVEIQLDVTDIPANQIESGYDVCVRFGPPPDSRLVARKLFHNNRYLCASPIYLANHGYPETPQDLAQHQCIVLRKRRDTDLWRLYRDGHEETVRVHGALSSNDGEVVMIWALQGKGILIRSDWYIHAYLESGRLCKVLPDWKLSNQDLYAVYPTRQNQAAKITTFVDFLSTRFSSLQRTK